MIDAIYILIFASMYLLAIALNKKDSTLIYFSGFLFVLSGLDIINNGFGSFKNFIYVGGVILFLGIYLLIRTSIELIVDKKEDSEKESKIKKFFERRKNKQ